MRRDDLQAFYLDVYASLDAGFSEAAPSVMRPASDAEALDVIGWKAALIHWLTDPCENCGGTGDFLAEAPDETEVCEWCGGTGREPAEGVRYEFTNNDDGHDWAVGLIAPLDWLGDDR